MPSTTQNRLLTRVSVALAAVAVVVPLSGCSIISGVLGAPAQPERDETTQEIVEEGDADVFALRVGDCLNGADGELVSEVPVVPCGEPHEEEVFFDFTLDGEEYPGDEVVQAKGDEVCLAEFERFVGLAYDSSKLEMYSYHPTEGSWNHLDDRVVACVILDPDAQTTGSLAGAAR